MRTKRVLLTPFAAGLALVALLVLFAFLTSAQLAQATRPLHIQEGVVLDDSIPATNHISVTFPGGLSYAHPAITIHPKPPRAHHPTEICAEVVNHGPITQIVELEFAVGNFGIGVPFEPVGATPVEVLPYDVARGCVIWVPPEPQHWCIEARLYVEGLEPQRVQRNIDVWESLVPGDENATVFQVGPFPEGGEIWLSIDKHMPDWTISVAPDRLTLPPGGMGVAELTTEPPAGARLGSREPVVDVEGFLDGEFIGGFRKFDWPPVPLHRPGEPFFAESEISVEPYPPRAGEPAHICAELRNLGDVTRTVELQFSWAEFGIGLPFQPINGMIARDIPPLGKADICTAWIPPDGGQFCVQAMLYLGDEYWNQFSQLNLDVEELLVPNESHSFTFPVGNHFHEFTNPDPVTNTIYVTYTAHLPGWEITLEPQMLPRVPAGAARPVTLTVRPPDGLLPPDGTPIVDVRAFIQEGEEQRVIGGFRKIARPPIPLHRFPDPPYAEREISVHPYPPRAGEPTEVCVELRNPTPHPQEVVLLFSWSHFGIGLPFHPVGGPRVVLLPPFSIVNECVHWIAPESGQVCLQVELEIEGHRPQASRLNLDVEEPLWPETPHSRPFPVRNPFEEAMTITLGLIPHLPDWGLELSQRLLPNVGAGQTRIVTLTVTPPGDLPPEGQPIVDVEAFAEGELIGGFRKVFRPPIRLHRFPDPPYAEREISVHPYPPRAGEPTEICVELRNPTPFPEDVLVFFSWAHFGIGLPFTPINGAVPVHLPPHSIVQECIHWIPPEPGQVCVQVELDLPGQHSQVSRLNLDVDEPLEPGVAHSRAFPVGNPFERPVTITLGLIPHLDGWGIELSQDTLTDMGRGEIRAITLTVTPPADLPADGDPIVDVEAFVEGELIGGFRKIFRPPVPIHRPQDPIYAESEIFVHPYPPRAREPTELGVEIYNPTEEPETITVTFSYAEFGIGLPWNVIDVFTVTVPDRGMIRPIIMWIPPHGGLWCIQIELEIPGLEEVFYSQRNIDVGEPLEPLVPHARPFEVGNPFTHEVTITLGLIPHFPDWGLDLSPDLLRNMAPGHTEVVTLTVTPPADLPEDGDPIVDVEAFVEGELIGGFRKIFRPPVPIHRPRDPMYAETEIGIDPYPVLPGQPTELSVEVFNPTDQDRVVTVTFSIARFGIGLPFDTAHIVPNPILIFVPAQGAARGHVVWEPPQWRGKFCVQVTLEMEGHDAIWSRRNIDVGEPLEPGRPHELDFPVGIWPYTQTVTVTLGVINHRDGWGASLSHGTVENIQPGEPVTVTLTVTPPVDAELGTGDPIVDVEAFVDGVLLGGFRKLDRPPIPLHKPHEKGYAESEISIEPYPPRAGEETRISTVVQNTSDTETTVELEFGWADFGMGIPFSTTNVTPITREVQLSPHMSATAWVTWTPDYSGHYCVRIILRDSEDRYEPQESQRNVDVTERPPCGQTMVYTFPVYNDSPFAATVDIGLITFDVPANWTVTTEPSQTLMLAPYDQGVVTVTVTIPCSHALRAVYAIQEEAGGEPTIDVEGYVDGELVGGIELRFAAREDEPPTIYLPIILKGF